MGQGIFTQSSIPPLQFIMHALILVRTIHSFFRLCSCLSHLSLIIHLPLSYCINSSLFSHPSPPSLIHHFPLLSLSSSHSLTIFLAALAHHSPSLFRPSFHSVSCNSFLSRPYSILALTSTINERLYTNSGEGISFSIFPPVASFIHQLHIRVSTHLLPQSQTLLNVTPSHLPPHQTIT